jgi:glycosyltransferase involved in cell wall biosynthesis
MSSTGRIVVVGPSGEPRGGVSKYVDDELSLLRGASLPVEHIQTGAGVPWVGRTPHQWWKAFARKLRVYQSLATLRLQPGTRIHLHLGFHYPRNDAAMCRLVRRRGADRVAVTLHGGRDEEWRRLLNRRFVRESLLMIDAVHVQTRAMERVLLGSPLASRTIYAPMTILRKSEPGKRRAAEEPLRAIYVGLITPTKGVGLILDAVETLRRQAVPIELVLVGSIDRQWRVEFNRRLAEIENAAIGSVRFLGPQPEAMVLEQLRKAHVFCIPSRWPGEGTPLAVIEAMSFSLPVVASRWRGLMDLVAHNETGCLLDTPSGASVARALKRLYYDEELRSHWAAATAERFDSRYGGNALAATMARLLDVPQALLGEPASR